MNIYSLQRFTKESKLRWHDVLTGKGFKVWIEKITEGNVPAGKQLDPFTTSNRRLIRVAQWLRNIQENDSVGASTPRTEDQARIDLRRAKLVEKDGASVGLSELGKDVLTSWQENSIADDDENHEIARAIVLAHHALEHNDPLCSNA